jgi:endogenous inhibitor of DNA gyrase (YacG/DUF329 family)
VLKCPTCSKPAEWQDNPWRPFCSERCKLIDFGCWANEEYRVPGLVVHTSTDVGELPGNDQGDAASDEEAGSGS